MSPIQLKSMEHVRAILKEALLEHRAAVVATHEMSGTIADARNRAKDADSAFDLEAIHDKARHLVDMNRVIAPRIQEAIEWVDAVIDENRYSGQTVQPHL